MSSPSSPCSPPGRAICRFSSICCSCSSSCRAASLAPERASRSMRSSMLCRSCERSLRIELRIERPRHLRVLAHLLGQRLQELVERGAQLIHQLLDLFVGGAALQRLAQRVLRRAQRLLGLGDVAVLDRAPPSPTAAPPRRAARRRSWRARAASRSSAGRDRRWSPAMKRSGAIDSASSAVSTRSLASASSARLRRCSISARASGLTNGRSGSRSSCGVERPSLLASSRATSVIDHVDAGPRMLGQILGGLADAVAGARLRQHQREVRRARRAAAAAWPRLPAAWPAACARTSPARRPRRSRPRSCRRAAARRASAAPAPW